jgi:hypothetical protein
MLILKKTEPQGTEGRWFTYADGVEFQIRPLTGQVLRKLRLEAVTTKMEFDQKKGRHIPVETVNDEKLEDVTADYLIQDFKGIGVSENQVMEATLENKKIIMDQIPLREFIWSSAQSLDIEADQVKNS